MGFAKLSFSLKDGVDIDIVSAMLQYHEVEAIWEEDSILHAYFDVQALSQKGFLEDVEHDLHEFITGFTSAVEDEVNWNKEWENNFQPVEIDDICYIYADFHKKKLGFDNYIKIAPKMAFGTGHHETTFMMIQTINTINLHELSVLDLGCGTGILAVYAVQKGAQDVDAIDIEVESFENSLEHAEMNDVTFNVIHGGVEDVPARKYDVVLANINRHVLLSYARDIIAMLSSHGTLLMSGILLEDESLIMEAYSDLELIETRRKGKWNCFHFVKRT